MQHVGKTVEAGYVSTSPMKGVAVMKKSTLLTVCLIAIFFLPLIACGLAPVITVDDNVHQRVKPNKVHEILERYREIDAQLVKEA